MKKYKWIIIVSNLILILMYFNYAVVKKEETIKNGQLILLELAPVDPRSLIQGDYMILRYKIAENDYSSDRPARGYCLVELEQNNTIKNYRFSQDLTSLAENEFAIKYKSINGGNISIGAESFFFQEGQAIKYEKAKYGGLQIDKDGNSILIALYDENKRKIE